jgi:hypothetical protein
MSSTNPSNDLIVAFLSLPDDQKTEALRAVSAKQAPVVKDLITELRREFTPFELQLQLDVLAGSIRDNYAIPELVGVDKAALEAALGKEPSIPAAPAQPRQTRNRAADSPTATRPLPLGKLSPGKSDLLAWFLSIGLGFVVMLNTNGEIDSSLNVATGGAHKLLTLFYFVFGWSVVSVAFRLIGKLLRRAADKLIPWFKAL